ncbi:MAG: hypothetical protein A3H70_01375 [Candidatus Komeilibacteria bacterium RIFCSPLOWO2_02_FULL_48_11]|uniref:EfeO-type cupredoxin-like domain-containing protein n=1 Tax=Candidatus Komeilibacteria bacterium RIFCSPLOWO2_02_FULL_48_11 TaxID=1798553 RepID=A0A1G2BRI5_9BACT|nr:MAG: hypothetical protein A3H70_01375 [Candidatus Komeilibacteria bacterium RIFCSPLOWO2_02_FULL_48_11]
MDNNATMPVGEGAGASTGGKNKGVAAKLIIILIVIAALAIIYMWARKSSQGGEIGEGANIEQERGEETAPPVIAEPETTPPAESSALVVLFTENGYEPASLTVKKGETATFTNTAANPTWPASAKHPTHTVYPGSDIAKCGTPEAANIFDACKGLSEGASWSFTFNEAGTWNYHDHLNPTKFGKIVVAE